MSATLGESGSLQFLPNLPGFKAKGAVTTKKKKYFSKQGETVFCSDPEENLPQLGDGDEANMGSSILAIGMTRRSGASTSRMTSADIVNMKLAFQAFFEETAGDPALEEVRVRKVNITYFLEDNTMMIVERPSLNSGVPQGTLVARGVVPKPNGAPYMPVDMKLGDVLPIFGRNFRLVDADHATRKYMRAKFGVTESKGLSVPKDAYEEIRKESQGGEVEEWGKYHSKKNANKDFMAASMGRFVDNSGREGFIKFGNDKLSFLCVWDNTYQLYGDKMEFTLKYHLADDTIEIFSVPNANSGRDGTFTKLLKRSNLPKNMDNIVPTLSDPVVPDYVHWTDLYIGLKLSVFGRQLKIIDADTITREFYEDYFDGLGPNIQPPPAKVIKFEREIPPPTGFGSEADSLASCSGASIRAFVRKKGDEKQLIFFASLLSGGIDDVNRRFVISFYLVDGTVKVQEPPIRNSGFVGGLFLSRRELKDPDGEFFDETNLWVGNELQILKHRFLLLGCNSGTLKYMEENNHKFTKSNAGNTVERLSANDQFKSACESGELATRLDGKVPIEALKAILEEEFGADVTLHELITLARKSGDRAGKFVASQQLIDEVVSPAQRFY